MTFSDILKNHVDSKNRKANAQKKLDNIRSAFAKDIVLGATNDVCVFAAGSLGRLDSGENSDLDVFVTAGEKVSRLQEIQYFSSILRINNELDFPALSNDGEFLKIFHITENQPKIGSANDDSENWFTTRMLLLLESNYLSNEDAYHQHKKAILDFYLRDAVGQDDFRPVFLLNDILRYWRTLCLNYEQKGRSSSTKSWKKKNFNLKFSRLLSVFGTVLPLILMKEVTAEKIEQLSSCVPMDRLASGLDNLTDADDLKARFSVFLDNYEFFLTTKETQNFDTLTETTKQNLQERADFIACFIFDALNHHSVPSVFKRYLVI